jgi:hypothetical protein
MTFKRECKRLAKNNKLLIGILLSISLFNANLIACKTEVSEDSIPDTFPPAVKSFSPSDRASDIDVSSSISISLVEPVHSDNITINTSDTSCTGSIQVSKEDFSTCVRMVSAPSVSSDQQSFTVVPSANLDSNTIYKIRLAPGIRDMSENVSKKAYQTSSGFTTEDIQWVSNHSPADAATDILLGSSISVTFALPMDTATVTTNTTDTSCSGSFQVSKDGFSSCVRMSSNSTISNSDKTFTIQPAVNLDSNTTYKIKLTSSIMDATGGNGLLTDYVTSNGFTTSDIQWISSTSPTNGDVDVSLNTGISVTFTQAMDASTVTTNTTGTSCSGSFQVSKDNFSSCVKMSSEPVVSNSDQTFTIQPTVNLDSNTNYKIKISSAVMDATGGNGLLTDYVTSTGFTTIDIISSITPSDGSMNFDISASVSVSFLIAMDTSTITTNTIDTSCSGSFQVSKDNFLTCVRMSSPPTASNGDKTFTIQPVSDLEGETNYKIRITSAVIDATGGNALVTDYTTPTGFTTRETVPPQIVSVSPTNNATNAAIVTVLTATFNEAINSSTINTSSFTLSDGTNDISGVVTYANLIAKFKPISNLDLLTNYTAVVTTSIQDVAGNALAADYTWTFKTGVVLPDTGQTSNYTSSFGEDSDYSINPPSYTDNGNGTVTDNNTRLIWQQSDDNTRRTWSTVTSYCTSLSLAGFNDWRLPNPKELQSIVHADEYYPLINTTIFPGTESSDYWSSTPNVHSPSDAWHVDFQSGEVYGYSETWNPYVRCVRGGSESDIWSYDFIDNSDGTVTHRPTDLTWQQEDDNVVRSWENALSYCENLSLDKYSDWRLPNFRELLTLVDYTVYGPAINSSLFPNNDGGDFWTSTTHPDVTTAAWRVRFYYGIMDLDYKSSSIYVRCVRGGH